MASRREERDRLRAERQAAERREASEARRRLIAGYIVAGALALAVVVGIVVVIASGGGGDDQDGSDAPENAHIQPESGVTNGFLPDEREGTPPPDVAQADLQVAAREAGCELNLDLPDEGAGHLEQDAEPPEYKTDPPTSGDHIITELVQADGAYTDPVEPIYWVHSLEHGRIAFQYSPDLPEAEQLELKGIFDESPAGMLLFPNPDTEYEVAASAWTQSIGCPSYEGAATLDAFRAFRDIYRGQGPEPVSISF